MDTADDAAFQVEVLLKHAHAQVTRVHLAPGAETPVHAHPHHYVVHPRATTRLIKTTYRGDDIVQQETVEHVANEPYYVAKTADGTAFSLKNVGNIAMLCDKTLMPSGGGGG